MASLICFSRRAIMVTLTRSPFSANSELRSATNTGLSEPSGINEFLPLALRMNVPSVTCPCKFRRYFPSPSFARKSSQVMSSRMSMASIFTGCCSMLSFLKICLYEYVSLGFCLKKVLSISTSCFLLRRLPLFFPLAIIVGFLVNYSTKIQLFLKRSSANGHFF